MKKKTLKIGAIGGGWIVENGHFPAFQSLPGVEIGAICDLNHARVKSLQKQFQIPEGFTDVEAFLASDLDAVIIATPNYTHARLAIEALQSGKHVLCEKPFAIHTAEARQMVEAAVKADRLLMPAFVNRFRPDISLIREFLAEGKIGEVYQIEAGWQRKNGIPRPGSWFTQKELAGGGVLFDLGSHVLDICLHFLGDANLERVAGMLRFDGIKQPGRGADWFTGDASGANKVSTETHTLDNVQPSSNNQAFAVEKVGSATVEDTVISLFQLDGGRTIHLQLSWCAPQAGDGTYVKLKGTNGSIELTTLFGFSNQRLWEEDRLLLYISATEESSFIPIPHQIEQTRMAFFQMALNFTSAIRGESHPLVTAAEGRRVTDFLEKVYQDAEAFEMETGNHVRK